MADIIDFPSNPFTGQKYVSNDNMLYVFDGVAWITGEGYPNITTTPWKRLYDDIKIQIPGVLDAVQAQVTFSLFKDFCDKTNIWQEEVAVPVLPDVITYPFVLLGRGQPNRLMMMYDPAQGSRDKHWVQGNVQMTVPGILTISYSPSTAATWNAVIAKTPIDPTMTDKYPNMEPSAYWIVDKYREALTFGILGRLQKMPGKPYSNSKEAKDNTQYYISERSKARTDMIKANTFGGQRWAFPQGFATTTRKGWA